MSEQVFGDRYRIEETLGRGGMATVYRGTDTVLGRAVAIKVLAPQFAQDPAFVDRFRREAQAAARLNHPNLVGVYDTGSDNGTHFIVMEYVEGRTIEDFLSKGGRMMPERAIEVATAVCDGLAYAHREAVIHRDIKSGNIMITKQGRVKVMDFGIARITTTPDTLSQTAAVLGTAAYLSPEQAQGEPVDARTDIYSLGVVIHEMLVGHVPFRGESAVAVAYKQVHENPPPPSKENADVSPALDAVVMRALAKNPANRYQTADELKADLQRASRDEVVEATPLLPASETQAIARPPPGAGTTQALPPQPPPARRRWGFGILVGVLIAAALGVGLYFLATTLLKGNTEQTKVLSVVGMNVDLARSTLQNAGCSVPSDVAQEFSDRPVGEVIGQVPAGGVLVPKDNCTVSLTVSEGVRQTRVPNLVGMTEDEARAALKAAHLKLVSVLHLPAQPGQTPGQVIAQTIPPDRVVNAATPVGITIATTPNDVEVPDLTCFSYGHAKSILVGLGLKIEVGPPTFADPLCPTGNKIAGQDPLPGKLVPPGSAVTVFIGSEPSPTPSPT